MSLNIFKLERFIVPCSNDVHMVSYVCFRLAGQVHDVPEEIATITDSVDDDVIGSQVRNYS